MKQLAKEQKFSEYHNYNKQKFTPQKKFPSNKSGQENFIHLQSHLFMLIGVSTVSPSSTQDLLPCFQLSRIQRRLYIYSHISTDQLHPLLPPSSHDLIHIRAHFELI